ncbi:MAG: PP2C family protein-serine/threonine phosphatase [Calditrichota bacterium]
MTLIKRLLYLVMGLLPVIATAQTQTSATQRSYLHPADSLYWDFALESGDVLEWNLWLAEAESGSRTIFSVESSIEGDKVRREFPAASAEFKDEIKATRAANYRLILRTEGKSGRVVSLGAWAKLSRKETLPFPLPGIQKFNRTLAAGDVYSFSFEFAAPPKTGFSELFQLDMPADVVRMWLITAENDSIPAVPTVKRWVGDPGRITLRGSGPQGGQVTLRLEVNAPLSGDAVIYLAPGTPPPAWVPSKVRRLEEQLHDPWKAVIVPPLAAQIESLRVKPPLPPRAQYAAISLRSRGVDSLLVADFTSIYAERDSLQVLRRDRTLRSTGYDTTFLTGRRAFVPPELQFVVTLPFSGNALQARENRRRELQLVWFVDDGKNDIGECRLYEYHYDEARVAPASVPDEFYWDPTVMPLSRTLRTLPAATFDKPDTRKLSMPSESRPKKYVRDEQSFVDDSRRVSGYYLANGSENTVYLVYRQASPVRRPAFYQLSRWPVGAKVLLGVFIFVALVGLWAIYELRNRERRRRKRAEEYAQELENARQVQLKLLPPGPLQVEGLEIFGVHQSMQSVGGDYYDFFPMEDGRVIVCIADVTGHGLPAALLMANLQATLRAVVPTARSICDVAHMLNHEIYQRTNPENFVTMLLAEISVDRTMMTFCNAGHNPGYIIRANGDIVELDEGGIMLGAMDSFPFVPGECGINKGDLIVFYTDGIPEAEIAPDDMFGYERLKFYLMQERNKSLPDLSHSILKRVTPTGAQSIEDDMALVLVRVVR